MGSVVNVNVKGIGELTVDEGSTLQEVAIKVFGDDYKKYLGARINNEVYHLHKLARDGMNIEFLDISHEDGYRIYTRTISLVFIMACKELYPENTVTIEQFLGKGLYAAFEGGKSISFTDINNIKARMKRIIDEDLTIHREKVPYDEGISLFEKNGHKDKVRLYKTLDKKLIQIYRIGDYVDGFHGFLAPSTGYVSLLT